MTPHYTLALSEINVSGDDISVETIPENPKPYENINIQLVSYATDLNKAMIQWQAGSSVLSSGYGKTSISYTTGAPNSITIIDITITPENSFDKIVKRLTINPSEVDLLWEAPDSYTPPFYKGKALPSGESVIRVVALPNTKTLKNGKDNVVYTWKNNGNSVSTTSGYNRDSYVFQNDVLKTIEKISVVASSVDSRYNAQGSIDIPIRKPEILFYKKSETEGILYNNALKGEADISEDEVTLVAIPYFMSIIGNEQYMEYNWSINGKSIETPRNKTEIVIRPKERGGYALIGLVFENTKLLFQKVDTKLKLNL